MTRILYFDCFSGISGDMTIGALVDAGVDPDFLGEELKRLDLNGEYHLSFNRVDKKGIMATKFDVHVVNEPHVHRRYADIIKLIENAGFNDRIKESAFQIFKAIGEAEAKIHGLTLEEVHFHEVGALDSILDIVGTAIAIEALHLDRILSSAVPVGNGKVHIDHGIYPIPAPAALELLKGIPLVETTVGQEMTTPTGAGIISAMVNDFGPIPGMEIYQIGYGAGSKDFQHQPNVLRVLIGEGR